MKVYNCEDQKMIARLQKISDKCEDSLWVCFPINKEAFHFILKVQFGFTINDKKYQAATVLDTFTSDDDDPVLNDLEALLELCYKETKDQINKNKE